MVCGTEVHCSRSFHKTKSTTEREFCCVLSFPITIAFLCALLYIKSYFPARRLPHFGKAPASTRRRRENIRPNHSAHPWPFLRAFPLPSTTVFTLCCVPPPTKPAHPASQGLRRGVPFVFPAKPGRPGGAA